MKVPEYTPSVSLRPNYQQDIDVSATPEAFGADIGRGMKDGLAHGMGQAAEAIAKVRDLEDVASAQNARNQFILAMDGEKFGEQSGGEPGADSVSLPIAGVTPGDDRAGGYLNTSGMTAIQGGKKFATSLEGLKKKFGNGLTPRAQALFYASADKFILSANRQAVRHRAAALKAQIRDDAIASSEIFKRQSIQSFADPQESAKFLVAGINEIENLGAHEGWSKRKLLKKTDEYRSDTLRLTGLMLAQTDPIAAAEFVQSKAKYMTPDQYLSTLNNIRPMLGHAIQNDAISSAKPSAVGIAASGLPREAVPLLSVIAGADTSTEGASNAKPVSVADDGPDVDEAETMAAATAGRYRISNDAWSRAAGEMNLPAGSGQSEAVAAWSVATQTYRIETGRDLLEDLEAGNLKDVREGLGQTFDGIRKLDNKEFAARLGSAVAATPSARDDIDQPVFSPRVSALLDELPAYVADGLREIARDGVVKSQAAEAARFKAHRLAVADDFKLRIETGDDTLSEQEILNAPELDNGDKASLISSFNSKRGDELKARKAVEMFQAGRLTVDPYDTGGKKAVDDAFALMVSTVESEKIPSVLHELVKQSGVVPLPALNAMRGDIASGTAAAVANAASLAASIHRVDPAALGRREGGKEVADAAVKFRYFTERLGLDPAGAAGRLIQLRDPEKRRERDVLLKSPDVEKFIKGQVSEASVRDIYDPGVFGFDPKLGETPAQSAAAVAEYRDMLEEAILDADGDTGLASSLAADLFRRRYGVSDFAISGRRIVRLPPEVTYPKDANDSHEYIRVQATEALKAAGVPASKVYLQADDLTQRDVMAGKPPRYQLFYVDGDGVLERYQHPFFATAPTRAEIEAARRAESEKRHAQNRERLEKAKKEKAELRWTGRGHADR